MISVIIPCRNEVKYIEKCMSSILDQKIDGGGFEVIIVDGMSDDGTREVIAKMAQNDKRIHCIDNLARTTPQAMNLGLAKAKFDLILRIDAHALALPGFITKSIDAVKSATDIMCAGGSIINIYENSIAEQIGFAMQSRFGVGNATFRVGGAKQFVDTLAFGIYKKEVFDKIGNFNEELVRNQDDELNFRLTSAGYKILYDPEIQSKYFVRSSVSKLSKQYYQYGYWKVYVNRMHQTITSIRQLVPLLFVLGLIFGLVTTVIYQPFIWVLLLGVAFYSLLAIFFGIKSAGKIMLGLKVARIFPILHFSYGWGYLRGIINFILLRKKPSERSKTVSRN